jgi:CheY-like chemotaxis protein
MHNRHKKDKRETERYLFKERIFINSSIIFKSVDISEGGLYVYTGRSFERNTILDVTFIRHRFMVKARVKHNQPGIGMGLQFIDLNEEQRAAIKMVIKEILSKTGRHSQERKKVLLVEDNDLTRSIYRGKLSMEGFSVMEAKDGLVAIKLLKEQPPDLIILDLHLKKMDGIKLLTILKETPDWMNVPVIVCSGKGTKDVIQKVIDAGADEFLNKMITSPAKLVEVAKAVSKVEVFRRTS